MARVCVAPVPSAVPWAVVRLWVVPTVSVVPVPVLSVVPVLRVAVVPCASLSMVEAVVLSVAPSPAPVPADSDSAPAIPIGSAALNDALSEPRCRLAYSDAMRSSRFWVSMIRSRHTAIAVVQKRNSRLSAARPRRKISPCWLASSSSTAPKSPSRVRPFFACLGSG